MPTTEGSSPAEARDIRRVHSSYLICTTQRSGSNLLCELLGSTGVAGRPDEYFCAPGGSLWFAEWGCSTYADYVAALMREATTANGLLGVKVMCNYLDELVGKLRAAFPEHTDLPRP